MAEGECSTEGDGGEVLFNVQGGATGATEIAVRRGLSAPFENLRWPAGWAARAEGPGDGDATRGRVAARPLAKPLNAYEVLLRQALQGDRSRFVGVDELLARRQKTISPDRAWNDAATVPSCMLQQGGRMFIVA